MSDEPAEKITVIHVRPGKIPQIVEMEDSLKAMQQMVGGMIEEYMPFYSADDELDQFVKCLNAHFLNIFKIVVFVDLYCPFGSESR